MRLWRRLDSAGHDACRLAETSDGWRLEGMAVFLHERGPSQLAYIVTCDEAWRSLAGRVHGWLGDRAIDLDVRQPAPGSWTLNGELVPSMKGCVDLDLGFTPATNALQLRRVALAIGQAADVPVAWLDVEAGTLRVLQQRYERKSAGTYWYEAPEFDYADTLDVDATDFPVTYPGLWEAEP